MFLLRPRRGIVLHGSIQRGWSQEPGSLVLANVANRRTHPCTFDACSSGGCFRRSGARSLFFEDLARRGQNRHMPALRRALAAPLVLPLLAAWDPTSNGGGGGTGGAGGIPSSTASSTGASSSTSAAGSGGMGGADG